MYLFVNFESLLVSFRESTWAHFSRVKWTPEKHPCQSTVHVSHFMPFQRENSFPCPWFWDSSFKCALIYLFIFLLNLLNFILCCKCRPVPTSCQVQVLTQILHPGQLQSRHTLWSTLTDGFNRKHWSSQLSGDLASILVFLGSPKTSPPVSRK